MDEVPIRFRLVGDEAQGLRLMAVEELRTPRDQLRLLLRKELHRRQLLRPPGGGETAENEEVDT